MAEITTFHAADYAVFALALAVSTAIGLGYGIYGIIKKRSAKEQMTGGNKQRLIPVSLSIIAAFQAAPFVIGTPAEIYTFGIMYSAIFIGLSMAIPVVAHVFIPIFHRLRLINGYQYFELRFNNATKLIVTAMFCVLTLIYMAVVVYAPAIAFSQVTGLSTMVSILGCGLLATFYTAVGGLGAVIWIDVLQMIVILAGLMVMAIVGSSRVGGWDYIMEVSAQGGRTNFNIFSVDPTLRTSFWSFTVGASFLIMSLLGSNQAMIQKYLSVGKLRDAQKTPYLVLVLFSAYLFLVCFLGLIMYAYFEGCDPRLTGQVQKNDQMILLFMMEVLGNLPGIPGLFTSAVFCASLSTVAAGINALAALTLLEFVRPAYRKYSRGVDFTERSTLILSKSLTAMYGVLTVAGAFVAPFLGDALLQIAFSVFGTIGGPILGLLFLGMFFPFANHKGAMAGLLTALVLGIWITIGSTVTGATRYQAFKVMLPVNTDNCARPLTTDTMINLSHVSTAQDVFQTTPFVDVSTQAPQDGMTSSMTTSQVDTTVGVTPVATVVMQNASLSFTNKITETSDGVTKLTAGLTTDVAGMLTTIQTSTSEAGNTFREFIQTNVSTALPELLGNTTDSISNAIHNVTEAFTDTYSTTAAVTTQQDIVTDSQILPNDTVPSSVENVTAFVANVTNFIENATGGARDSFPIDIVPLLNQVDVLEVVVEAADDFATQGSPPQSLSPPSFLWLYRLSFLYYALASIIVTLTVGCVVSLLTGGWQTRHQVDRRLLFQFRCHVDLHSESDDDDRNVGEPEDAVTSSKLEEAEGGAYINAWEANGVSNPGFQTTPEDDITRL